MDTLHKKWSFPWGNSSENVGPNPQETADLVTFTEEILNGKIHFLGGDSNSWLYTIGCKFIIVGWVIHFWMLNDFNFVWLETFAILVDKKINIF